MQGLYRFDGVSFERYEPQSGSAFQSSNIVSLLALPNGDLWIGFREKGVSLLRDGSNTNYTDSDGLPSGSVTRLVQDRDGAIWAATDGGLARFEHGRWQRIGKDWGYPAARAKTLYLDRQGTLWVAGPDTVVFLPHGSRKFQTTGIKIGYTYQIIESPRYALWMAETTRSVHPLLLPSNQHGFEPEIQVGSMGIVFDDDGSLWVTSVGDGMRRVPFPDRLTGQKIGQFSGVIESFTSSDGLSSDYETCILKDREGSIWVGTSAGLDRFRRSALAPILLPARFTQKTLVPGDDGDVWVASLSDALARIEGNTWKDVRPGITSLYGLRDSHGAVWFLGMSGLIRITEGKPTLVIDTPAGIDTSDLGPVLAEDRAGTLWLADGRGRLLFLRGSGWEPFEMPPEVAGKEVLVTFTDVNGRVWFGFTDNTILTIEGTNVRTFSAKDGIQVRSVKAITGRDRHVWVGGEDGLAVWEGDRFRPVVPADGDTFHGVSGVQEDSGGDLFLSEERGVVFIPATEVSKILKDHSARFQYQRFDVRDGLPGAVLESMPYPSAVQGTDGRIWFSTSTGVAWIDPAHIPKNPLPPPIVIRSITANGTHYRSPADLRLPPRTRDLTIDYTALSLAVPDRVRFRYKLEGSDTQWQDAGTRRQAFYTNLSPGEYRFRVIACNNDGVWNESGATLPFFVTPAWYQTNFFRVSCFLAGILLLWTLHRLRMRQVARALSLRFDERLSERTRIAREFHDTLLQTIQGSKLVADNALDPPADPTRMRHAMEQLSEWLDRAIQEGRAALNSLRTSATETNDLAEGLRRATEECRMFSPMETSFSVEGDSKEMHPVVRDEIYRIGYEAIRNASVHSKASRLHVGLKYGQDLAISVGDNGVGIPESIINRGTDGHYGLQGMRERAARIGGKLRIVSSVDSGTEVSLVIPGRIAFREAVAENNDVQ